MSEICITCGMPLQKQEDFGARISGGNLCTFCTSATGEAKSCEEIFEGGVSFFLSVDESKDRNLATKITRKNMKSLPYWNSNTHECLQGEEATDEEFAEVLKKLHS